MIEFVMPILGADMEAGTLVEWRRRPGERVERGEVIAEVGASGNASGPHVHFEVRRNRAPQDPLDYLDSDPRGTASAPPPAAAEATTRSR